MKRNHLLLLLFLNKFKEALIQFRICLNEKLKNKQIKKETSGQNLLKNNNFSTTQ